jgi:hypothetical protein
MAANRNIEKNDRDGDGAQEREKN